MLYYFQRIVIHCQTHRLSFGSGSELFNRIRGFSRVWSGSISKFNLNLQIGSEILVLSWKFQLLISLLVIRADLPRSIAYGEFMVLWQWRIRVLASLAAQYKYLSHVSLPTTCSSVYLSIILSSVPSSHWLANLAAQYHLLSMCYNTPCDLRTRRWWGGRGWGTRTHGASGRLQPDTSIKV